MPKTVEWSFPEDLQPDPEHVDFDLGPVFDAVVHLRVEIPEAGFTANTLGTERTGNGVIIDDGIIVTIGYLITEAESVWITTNKGKVLPGIALAYDQVTGFGLIRAIGGLDASPIERATAHDVGLGDRVFMIGHGGATHSLRTRLIAKRVFAGYWEYLIEESLVISPAHPHWSGAALVSEEGKLVGIGSLLMQESEDGKTVQTNMVVPIDLLDSIYDNLVLTGRSGLPPRPWLGLFASDDDDQVVVVGTVDGSPADEAEFEQGDLILEVAGQRVSSLAGFLKAVWAQGSAGVRVPLVVARDGDILRKEVGSVDRNDLLHKPTLQ